MKLTPWMLSVAAFGLLGLMAATYFYQKLTAHEVVVARPVAAPTMPMAITEIEPGTVITMKHIGNGPVAPNEVLAPDTIRNLDSIVGRIAKVRIPSAIPLQGSMFYSVGDYPTLQIENGKRAVTVSVDDATAILSGLIKIGQFVDVYMTTDTGMNNRLQSARASVAAGRSGMTVTLFKGVKVVAINRGGVGSPLQGGGNSHNVTLELDENQSLIMLLAQEKGRIALTYNPAGVGVGGIDLKLQNDRVTTEQLLGMTDAPKPFRTESFRGAGRSSTFWQDGERIDSLSTDDNDSSRTPNTGNPIGGLQSNSNPAEDNNLTQQPTAASGTL